MKHVVTIAAALLLAACAEEAPEDPAAVGLANPASVFCIESGGKLEIRDTPEGQVGYCHLPDGRVVEEWQYFREHHPAE